MSYRNEVTHESSEEYFKSLEKHFQRSTGAQPTGDKEVWLCNHIVIVAHTIFYHFVATFNDEGR